MSSLFLGKLGNEDDIYEIHALTNKMPFREFGQSEISDVALFNEIITNRFHQLEKGKPMYCTAINPDMINKIELNPHDTREGTFHIVAINKSDNISCCLSVAVDIEAKDKGSIVGLPLENCWKRNGYPEGASLENIREQFVKSTYHINKRIQPWEMAETYRHFKITEEKDNLACRLGVYAGCYHLLVREARKKGLTKTVYWVFDAIPAYFQLYRYAGAAVLRDFTIANPIKLISPNKKEIKKRIVDGQKQLFFDDILISRSIKIPFPNQDNGSLSFKNKDIPFLDGIIDINQCEKSIQHSPITLQLNGIIGFNVVDRIRLRFGLGVIGKRVWDEDYHSKNVLSNMLNNYILKKTGSRNWLFNSIGSNDKP